MMYINDCEMICEKNYSFLSAFEMEAAKAVI